MAYKESYNYNMILLQSNFNQSYLIMEVNPIYNMEGYNSLSLEPSNSPPQS
jgi:hypothetical protein